MKNFLDLPRREDFFKTTFLDLTQGEYQSHFKKKDIRYRKGFVNMRNIVDLSEFNVTIKVIDEERFPDFEAKMKEYGKNNLSISLPRPAGVIPMYPTNITDNQIEMEMPTLPTKDVTLKGTTVLYFNGAARMIMTDFKEFESIYFEYLQKEKLDY